MSRSVQLAGGLSFVLAALLPQTAALLLLSTADFGRFSVLYLIYAWGISLGLSLVAEPWQLRQLEGDAYSHWWRPYGSVALILSVVVGLSAVALSYYLAWAPIDSVLGGLAIGAGCVRNLMRHSVAQRRLFVRLVGGDMTFILTFGTSLAICLSYFNVLTVILVSWSLASLGSLLWTPRMRGPVMGPARWLGLHMRHMRRLVMDSTLMDIGAIGTPVIVAGVLDFASFGLYRAVSNVSAPARMVLEPARPYIFQHVRANTTAPGRQTRTLGLVSLMGAGLGLGAFSALSLMPWDTLGVEVLGDLSPYAVVVGACVIVEFIGHFSYIAVRAGNVGRGLFRGRVLQTIVVTVMPVTGALVWGGSGAVVAYACASGVTCLIWVVSARRENLI